jgi:hypothetical protein
MSDASLHRIVTLAAFEAPARLAMDPAAFDDVAGIRAHVAPPTSVPSGT